MAEHDHGGHRKRLKENFLENGLESFEPHNVLELLLFFSIPQKDTNDIAHALINEFGSVSAVFDAPYEDLLKVKGVGENTACLLKLIPEISRAYHTDKFDSNALVMSSKELEEYVKAQYIGCTVERVIAVCFDNTGKHKATKVISEGVENVAQVDVKRILQLVLKVNATNVVIAHNHPNGVAAPSRADLELTANLASVLSSIACRLSEHYIVAGDDCIALSKNKNFVRYFLNL